MNRRKQHEYGDGISEEAAFEFGVLYSTVKTNLISFAAQGSNPYTFADLAARVGRMLQAEALRPEYGGTQLVPEMRQNGARHYSGRSPRYRSDELAATPLLPDGAPGGRALTYQDAHRLSVRARRAIGKAQRERWARFHREQKRVKGSPQAKRKRAEAKREYNQKYYRAKRKKATPDQKRARYVKSMRNYWAKMSPAERQAEMIRRRKVSAEKRSQA